MGQLVTPMVYRKKGNEMFEVKEHNNSLEPSIKMKSAYSKIDGGYIGDVEAAKQLHELGICPQLAKPGNKVCSIGFNPAKNEWSGWSHRAMATFRIGSRVKKGHCAYVPKDWDDLRQCAVDFWHDEYHEKTSATRGKDQEGRDCILVEWKYSNSVPNEKLRGTTGGAYYYPPDVWGKGEWVAETLEDAQQMAIDFAESVS